MRFIGFDPGGQNAFGWAVLSLGASGLRLTASGTCSGASEAIEAAQRACLQPPSVVAIDAPLFWRDQGDRAADAYVRTMVCACGGSSGTVSHVNSLRGACLVQGILVARAAIAAWPEAKITEAHPKALLRVWPKATVFVEQVATKVASEHERDAALAAFTAHQFHVATEGWRNLAELDPLAHDPIGVRAAYWFPRKPG